MIDMKLFLHGVQFGGHAIAIGEINFWIAFAREHHMGIELAPAESE